MGGSADAGIRRSPEVAVTRFSLADGGREGVGCGTAKGEEPTVGPSRRDCRRRFGSCGGAKRRRSGDPAADGRILPGYLSPVRTIPAPGRVVRGRTPTAHGERTARRRRVVLVRLDRHVGVRTGGCEYAGAGCQKRGRITEVKPSRPREKMPIDIDIREHEVLGPMLEEARQKGLREGVLIVLRRQIEKRFGAMPNWAAEKLAGLSTADLEDLSVSVLDARKFEVLLNEATPFRSFGFHPIENQGESYYPVCRMDRRRFIVAGLTGTAVSCARSKSPWRFLSVEEARTVEAVCAHIIPQAQVPVRCRPGLAFSTNDKSPDFKNPCRKPTGKGSRQSTTRA